MDLRSFFEQEVKPALGCTEPGAVALATATASRALEERARSIRLRLSANVFKNGISVGIPGTRGLRGNLMAAALGALCGDPEKACWSSRKCRLPTRRKREGWWMRGLSRRKWSRTFRAFLWKPFFRERDTTPPP